MRLISLAVAALLGMVGVEAINVGTNMSANKVHKSKNGR